MSNSANAQTPMTRSLDWGQVVQCLLRVMDSTVKNESSRGQAERMANELLQKSEMLHVHAQAAPDDLVGAAKALVEEISTRGTHERWKRLDNALYALSSTEDK